MNDEIKVPESYLFAEVGWLSPEGNYYPCDYDREGHTGGYFHLQKAIEIVHHFYPGQVGDEDYGDDGGPQTFLSKQGWIRLDIKDIMFFHRPTQPQVDTLFDLYRLKPQRYLPTEQLRAFLAWCGLKFLGKPDDDPLHFEASLPLDEIKMEFPKLTPMEVTPMGSNANPENQAWAYVGRAPCGCIQAFVVEHQVRHITATYVAEMIVDGLIIERVPAEQAKFQPCPHKETPDDTRMGG